MSRPNSLKSANTDHRIPSFIVSLPIYCSSPPICCCKSRSFFQNKSWSKVRVQQKKSPPNRSLSGTSCCRSVTQWRLSADRCLRWSLDAMHWTTKVAETNPGKCPDRGNWIGRGKRSRLARCPRNRLCGKNGDKGKHPRGAVGRILRCEKETPTPTAQTHRKYSRLCIS
jgi:hypothetical protein